MVECDLAKVEVAGSNPVSRSIILLWLPLAQARVYALWSKNATRRTEARYPSGKGEVCKTFMRRFDSDPRLQRFNHYCQSQLDSRCQDPVAACPAVLRSLTG